MLRAPLALMLLAAASACHKAPKAVGGLNPDDAAALNNAAEMLDTSADDLTTPPNGATNSDQDDSADNAGNGD